MKQTRYRVIVWIETALADDVTADCLVELHTIVDIGNGVQGIVGQVVGVAIGEAQE